MKTPSMFFKTGQAGVACTLDPDQGKNARLLRPLAQLAKALEAGRKQHGFDDAQAIRPCDGDVVVRFESGLLNTISVRSISFDLHIGRLPRLVIASVGSDPVAVTLSPTLAELDDWIKVRPGAGCIHCMTEDASMCQLCNRVAATATAATSEVS